MTTTRILTFVFGIIAIGLGYYLYNSIASSITEAERIERLEGAIIKKLKQIREAELAYKAVNGQYTSDWDTLISFVDSGSFYLVERIETIITLDYGADSTHVQVDTLGTILVKDSVFSAEKHPGFVASSLPFIPGVEPSVKFNIWADKINKAGILVDVIEVVNPNPVDPNRSEDSDYDSKKPLRFGSRSNVTTAGNWE